MRIAVCLFKFFPYSGLCRDFLRIMDATIARDDQVDVYVMEWQGDIPPQLNVIELGTFGFTNHGRISNYQRLLLPKLHEGKYDLVFGFNKMPNLDLYYAADPCYIDRQKKQRFFRIKKLLGRTRLFWKNEKAVFGKSSHTVSLMISDVQTQLFKQHYETPLSRLIDLPPGIDPERARPDNASAIRRQLRKELGINDEDWMLLLVGSAFHTKGVDRAIAGFAEMDEQIKAKTFLYVLGQGEQQSLLKQATRLGLDERVHFLGGRKDVSRFLLAADLLIHPARKENTGTVILEAMVSGLPMLVSDVCGYAKHVTQSGAGMLLRSPNKPKTVAEDIMTMLDKTKLSSWHRKSLKYTETVDLYSMPQVVANIIRQQINIRKNVNDSLENVN